MPKPSAYTLIWSDEHQNYDLHLHGQRHQSFRLHDESAWLAWVQEQTTVAFHGQSGHLSLIKEVRPRGSSYWYAYRRQAGRTHKRYLGPSARLTFAHLEQIATELTHALSPSSRTPVPKASVSSDPSSSLLTAKLSAPRLPNWLIERSRLLRELDAVHAYPLTLVSASAGSGKTTLLSAWVMRPGEKKALGPQFPKTAFAWLSLDVLDTRPISFWTSVIAALRTCFPRIGEAALALLHSPEAPPPSTILTNLLNELARIDSDIILILDDYHVISEQSIHETLRFLLEHVPANLHLVLATRNDPPLPLSLWRMRGHLLEIRDQDLRFHQVEAASFLMQGMGLPLSEEEVAILETRTEGWIAGLQLAALALRKHEDRSAFVRDFAGTHRYLLDYVQQDILAQLPLPLQDFLLQTAIVPRMNAALCQALTGSPSPQVSQQMLEELEQANLFVVPLDSRKLWYRYHDLFREALQVRLHASQPELVPLLHLRAVHWYERAGELQEAITHALAAPDYPYAAALMEQAAPALWLSGEGQAVQNLVLALPDTVLCTHIRLALNAALRLINSINLSNDAQYASLRVQIERTVTRMERMLRNKQERFLSEIEAEVIERRLLLLRALIEAWGLLRSGNQERLSLLSLEIEALPQDEEMNWSLIPLTLTFWLHVYLQGEGASLIPRLQVLKQVLLKAGDQLATIRVRIMLAHAFTKAAQWHQAEQECLETLALVEQRGMRTIWSGYLAYNLHLLFYTRNRLEEAEDWLQRLQRSAQEWQQVELLVRWEIRSARFALVRRDLANAREALHRLGVLVEREGYVYHVPSVAALRARIWLEEGDLVHAALWVEQTTFSPWDWNPVRKEECLLVVHVLLALQQYTQASAMLARFKDHLDRPGDIGTTTEFLALQIIALHVSGEREEAQRVAARLFELARPEDAPRVYLDMGVWMQSVLQAWLSGSSSSKDETNLLEEPSFRSHVLHVLAMFAQEAAGTAQRALNDNAPSASLPDGEEPSALPGAQPQMIDPLSRQEQRVLSLLVAGYTYAEMAEVLIVSPNTVKTQVSAIYRKLGVNRRAEAIAAARQLHWL